MEDEGDIYELRRLLLLDWFVESKLTKQDFAAKIGMSPSYLTRVFYEPGRSQRKKIDTDIARRIELALDRDGEMLNPQKRQHRELSTSEDVGIPRKGGHTTTVNLTMSEVKQGSILPLVPWNRVELMLLPNDDPEVVALERQEIRANLFELDLAADKAVLIEGDIPGTEVKPGFIAVFRPVPKGKRVRQTDLPIVVKSPSGSFHFMSYNSLALAPKDTEVIAVCIDAYKPRQAAQFWD